MMGKCSWTRCLIALDGSCVDDVGMDMGFLWHVSFGPNAFDKWSATQIFVGF